MVTNSRDQQGKYGLSFEFALRQVFAENQLTYIAINMTPIHVLDVKQVLLQQNTYLYVL